MSGPGPRVDPGMKLDVHVVVVGAGQAGLSAAYYLRRWGLEPGADFVVLDREQAPGGAWQHRWPTLNFQTVHGVHQLPGRKFAEPDPATPVNQVVPDYFAEYEQELDLQVRRPVTVTNVHDGPDSRLTVETDTGTWISRGLINATGTWHKPFWPSYPGQASFTGRQLHTADYTGPDEFAGKRVVIVGGGASAIGHLLEIAKVAEAAIWVTRRPPEFTDLQFDPDWGRKVEARVAERVRAGKIPESVIKVTGYPRTPAIAAAQERGLMDRLPMFDRITPTGVAWDDGRAEPADVILWATGFRAVLDHLAPLKLRHPAGGVAIEGTKVIDDPRIHLVGYGPSASTIGANRAGLKAARELLTYLGDTPAVLPRAS